MSRPWSCPTHGPHARTRWRRNGTHAGTPKRTRVCAECQPAARGPSIQGRTTCPRCGSARIVTVSGGRPGQGPYRGCADCRAARQLRWKIRASLTEVPEWAIGADPALSVAEAIESARSRGRTR